jgi:hypothetical protein
VDPGERNESTDGPGTVPNDRVYGIQSVRKTIHRRYANIRDKSRVR